MKKKKQHLKVLEQNGDREGIDFSSFYGCYEKMMRKKLGYSLENVSRDLYISKGSLSEEVDAFLWLDKNKQKKVRERFQKIKEKAEKSYACFLEKLIDYFE